MATDPESRFLELCSREGMESLRRECTTCQGEGQYLYQYQIGDDEADVGVATCFDCFQGWLPLPEAERMGALVRVAGAVEIVADSPDKWFATYAGKDGGPCSTPEAALTEALLVATGK